MTDAAAFETSLAKLDAALAIADVLWVREHTKWLGGAMEWDRTPRAPYPEADTTLPPTTICGR